MNFTEEQHILQQSVQRFISDRYGFEDRRHKLLKGALPDPGMWAEMAELGWLALPVPEENDGLGGSEVYLALLFKEFGKGLVVDPYLPSVVMAGKLLELEAAPELRRELLEQSLTGATQFAVAWLNQQQVHALDEVTVQAAQQGDALRLTGDAAMVLNGQQADYIIIPALLDNTPSLFLVARDAEGLQFTPYENIDGSRSADITLDNVPVHAQLNASGNPMGSLRQVLDLSTFSVCAEAVGCMESLLYDTVSYTKERKQFGVPISKFQVLQHRMVDMFIHVQKADALLWATAEHLTADELAPEERSKAVSTLKALISTGSRYVSQQGVQLHGGMGVTDELRVGHYMKRLVAIDLLFGNEEQHLAALAKAG